MYHCMLKQWNLIASPILLYSWVTCTHSAVVSLFIKDQKDNSCSGRWVLIPVLLERSTENTLFFHSQRESMYAQIYSLNCVYQCANAGRLSLLHCPPESTEKFIFQPYNVPLSMCLVANFFWKKESVTRLFVHVMCVWFFFFKLANISLNRFILNSQILTSVSISKLQYW